MLQLNICNEFTVCSYDYSDYVPYDQYSNIDGKNTFYNYVIIASYCIIQISNPWEIFVYTYMFTDT